MSTFLSLIPSASTTGLDLNHYSAVAGFLDIHGDASECGIMQDIKITCTSPSARYTLLTSLAALVNTVQQRARLDKGNEHGVLTYMAFKCLDNELGVRIFGRWETRDTFEAFIRREEINEFWMNVKECVRGMEQRLYVPNGKGWLHRGSGFAGEKEGTKAKM